MRVLAVGAHPDDLEINAFGTLALHAKRGDDVFICGVANGCMGHREIMPPELAKIRLQESQNAARIIGAKMYYHLDVDDLAVDSRNETVLKNLVDVIREVRPDYIITHRTDEYHRDHNETGELVFIASFNATIPHYLTRKPSIELVPSLYYLRSTSPCFTATDYVDISEAEDRKLEALACHKSQVEWLSSHENMDLLESTRATDAAAGSLCRAAYAEAFMRCMQECRITAGRLLP